MECCDNQLIELPKLCKQLWFLRYYDNPIFDFIQRNFTGSIDNYCIWKLNLQKKYAVWKIETWFLECKYNPKYLYCQKMVDGLYDQNYLPEHQ